MANCWYNAVENNYVSWDHPGTKESFYLAALCYKVLFLFCVKAVYSSIFAFQLLERMQRKIRSGDISFKQVILIAHALVKQSHGHCRLQKELGRSFALLKLGELLWPKGRMHNGSVVGRRIWSSSNDMVHLSLAVSKQMNAYCFLTFYREWN